MTTVQYTASAVIVSIVFRVLVYSLSTSWGIHCNLRSLSLSLSVPIHCPHCDVPSQSAKKDEFELDVDAVFRADSRFVDGHE